MHGALQAGRLCNLAVPVNRGADQSSVWQVVLALQATRGQQLPPVWVFQKCEGSRAARAGMEGSVPAVLTGCQLGRTWQKHICVSMWSILAPHRCGRIHIINRVQI